MKQKLGLQLAFVLSNRVMLHVRKRRLQAQVIYNTKNVKALVHAPHLNDGL